MTQQQTEAGAGLAQAAFEEADERAWQEQFAAAPDMLVAMAEEIDVPADFPPQTIAEMAEEQQAFLATVPDDLEDVLLPSDAEPGDPATMTAGGETVLRASAGGAAQTTIERYTCPVCGYDNLQVPVEMGEICPSCGTEYGFTDEFVDHLTLRQRWITGGMKWWSNSLPAPPATD